jgi:hypothetical protein
MSLAEPAGLQIGSETDERVSFDRAKGGGGTFSVVAGGQPTAGLRFALPASRAADLVDPDGNSVELVL